MAHESFENNDIAEILNRSFIAIKVDREERPDIDHLYMSFCQALTGSGGWPLTILMTPEKKPFYTGTYFPRTSQFGRPGLMDILEQISELWRDNEAGVRESAEKIVTAVHTQSSVATKGIPLPSQASATELETWGIEVIDKAYQGLARVFDSRYGGFGRAPKFPSPHNLTFLLRYAQDHPESQALAIVRKTLDGMALGGIYDHIGYGFARYSTDEKWLVPHFEKMLYDNALLALTYLESYQVSREARDAVMAEHILTYVLRDMTAPEGGFYSAEDADAEGVEGKFHVWTPEEIKDVLSENTAQKYCEVYNVTPRGNFDGKSIPNLLQGTLGKQLPDHPELLSQALESLEAARQALFTRREQRIHPHKDDKILTSWNGLMITALARAAQVLENSIYLDAAEKAGQFILTNLRRDKRLLARYHSGDSDYLGYLDDYAFLIEGLIELYETCGKPDYLKTALELQAEQEQLFRDQGQGGYFLTGSDAEELLLRPKESYDGALPSGNSVTARNLIRLARLTGDDLWQKKAEELFLFFRPLLENQPTGYTAFLQALQSALHPSQELIFAGSLSSPELAGMREFFFSEFHPYASILYQDASLEKIIPRLQDYPLESEQTTAYLCQNFTCQTPVHNLKDFQALLNNQPS